MQQNILHHSLENRRKLEVPHLLKLLSNEEYNEFGYSSMIIVLEVLYIDENEVSNREIIESIKCQRNHDGNYVLLQVCSRPQYESFHATELRLNKQRDKARYYPAKYKVQKTGITVKTNGFVRDLLQRMMQNSHFEFRYCLALWQWTKKQSNQAKRKIVAF